MKKVFFAFLLFCLSTATALYAADQVRIAVLDFEVQTINEDYLYFGKGFAEFMAVELYEYTGVQLIDRKKRNEILEEQSLSLTGYVDEDKTVELGRILTAEYMLTGHIFDLLDQLILTVDMIDVETGEIVLKLKSEGSLADYNTMIQQIGKNIATLLFGVKGATKSSSVMTVKQNEAQANEVLINFSDAIDAYDNNDLKTAKKKLTAAGVLDPGSRAILYYLNKLFINTSRFNVMPSPYYSRENPAALSQMKDSSLSVFTTFGIVEAIFGDGWPLKYPLDGPDGPGGEIPFVIQDNNARFVITYKTPLGDKIGISVEGFSNLVSVTSQEKTQTSENQTSIPSFGLILNAGFPLSSKLSIGAGCTLGMTSGMLTYQDGVDTIGEAIDYLFGSLIGGFILKNRTGDLIYSLYGGITNQKYYFSDDINFERPTVEPYPVYIDQTITRKLSNNKTFLVSKIAADLSLSDNIYHYFQPLFAVENWFTPDFSGRIGAGYFFNYTSISDIDGGFGGNIGSTIIIPDKWEIDLSVTFRKRPTTIGENELVPEVVINVGIVRLNPFR